MRQIILTSFFTFLACSFLIAQITVTNATFPEAGDTLRTATDNMPQGIDLTAPGGNQTWDFTNLTAPFSSETIYRPASEGTAAAEVPNADIFSEVIDQAENYYVVTDESVELVAFNGPDPIGFNFSTLIKFSPPVVDRRAPMTFPSNNVAEGALLLPFAAEDLPGGILDSLPITPDSIRLRINFERVDFVDAWGTLAIPGGTFDVLREKRTQITETRVDVKLGFFPWQDITDLIGPLFEDLGTQTTINYYYFSEDAKEPIAVVTTDELEETVTQVVYKSIDDVNTVQPIQVARPGVYAYPNPAINDVRFDFTNLNAGNYSLKIYNILGVTVWEKDYYVTGSRTEKISLSHLRKGTYLYSLQDNRGKTLVTKRLMIVRP